MDDETPNPEDEKYYRRLVGAVLLRAVHDAREGCEELARWVISPEACWWARLIQLEKWPPSPAQLATASRRELSRRVQEAR